jgi:D-aspartate ligase
VLFATHDEAIAAIGPREAEVDAVLRRPWSPWPAMRGIMDKGHQHAAAHAAGFPVPATVTPADEADLASIAGQLRFPVILKPRDAPEFRRRFHAQVLEAVDAEGLRRAWELAAAYRPQVSEVIPGDDSRLWTLGSYRDVAGRPLASFTGHKLRQWPPRFGTARAAESRWDPGLAARCHGLLDALGFHGISQVEVKRDDRDGRDYLIEVNPRSWLWVGLATACGVNLPYACWLDAVGRPRTWPAGHRGGRRWILASKHLAGSVREVRRGEWGLRPFLSSLRPPIADGVIDPRDPRPALALYSRIARRRFA